MANMSILNAFERMWEHVTTALGKKSDISHTHNDLYYTEAEVDSKVSAINTSITNITNGTTKVGKATSADSATSANTANTANAVAWGNVTGKPSAFTPSTHNHDDRYYTETEVDTKLSGKSDVGHNHDTAYYDKTDGETLANTLASVKEDVDTFFADADLTESAKDTLQEIQQYITSDATAAAEMTASIASKADKTHTHNYAGSSSAGGAATSANKVNKALIVKLNSGTTEGTNMFTFDGSGAKSINVTPSSIGAATSSHTHDDRYYTETEVDTIVEDKSDVGHTHTVSHTPAGTVSKPTFTGSVVTSGTPTAPSGTSATTTVASSSHTHEYTPSGTVSKPSFTGTKATISAEYTPAGSVSQPSFTGSAVTSGAPSGTATTVASSTHTHKYTPAGTVSKPTFTGTAVTSGEASGATTVYSITAVGSLPTLTASVANKCLTLAFSAGTLPTKGSGVSVATGAHTHSVTAAGTVSQPTFAGTEASTTSITGTTKVANEGHTHSVTASGTVSKPTFTGTEDTISAEYTPAGSVSQPSFTGTKASTTSITGTTSVASSGHIHSVTAAGSVSQPTFTGTAETLTTSEDN